MAKTSGPIPSIKSTSNNNNNNNSDSQDNSPTFPCASLLQAFKNDDFASFDEVKVFNEEGEGDCDPKSGDAIMTAEEIEAALLEEKSSLIRETEMGIKQELAKLDSGKLMQSRGLTSVPICLSQSRFPGQIAMCKGGKKKNEIEESRRQEQHFKECQVFN